MHHTTYGTCRTVPDGRRAALLLLPGLAEIARAVERGESLADHLPTLARIVSRAEREHHPALDACAVYCDAIAWLREVAR